MLEHFVSLGFFSVGFSPMLASPTGRDEMTRGALTAMLEQMVACRRRFEMAVAEGERYPFLNIMTALHEIRRGTHRPYPCGGRRRVTRRLRGWRLLRLPPFCRRPRGRDGIARSGARQ
jgi:hypothetical protein